MIINRLKSIFWLFLIMLVFFSVGCRLKTFDRFEQSRELMGTVVTITVYATDNQQADDAMEAAFDKMIQIENIANTFDPGSENFNIE
ncbi:MAG: hypothetical protein U5N58_08030 [Actinomycetota bacterium]|nr:hypothetical protein [Actinomycetota bacterium]